MARTRWEIELEQLSRDNRSGAEELASRAVNLLIDVVGDSIPAGMVSYRTWLLRISRDMVAAQPSMGNVFRLMNDLLWACADMLNPQTMRQQALSFLQQRQQQEQSALEALADAAIPVLERYAQIMTYSRSSSVLRTLSRMAEQDTRIKVMCGEGRPMFEGQTLASELTWAGLRVTLGVDMALFGWLDDMDALVVGADSLSSQGLVNKVGTAALMAAATEAQVPRIVLCTSYKFLPADYLVDLCFAGGDPAEIMPVADDLMTVRNQYFDRTPLHALTAVVTERGLLEGEALKTELAAVRTHPGIWGR